MSIISRVLKIKQETWETIKRMAVRTVVLTILIATGFALVDHLVESGMADQFALVRRFPEMIPFMMAATKFVFIMVSLFWVRIATQPKNDTQDVLLKACETPAGAAVVHVSNVVRDLAWIGVFIYLVG